MASHVKSVASEKDTGSEKLLKMKELCEQTDVTSGTIRYYIKQGLLPEPHKPHKNMAYYEQGYVDKIKLIKDLQEKHYLPLNVIKMILDEKGYDEAGVKDWLRQVDTASWFETQIENNGTQVMTREELLQFTGIDPVDFDAAVSYNMLIPDKNGQFDKENIKTALLASEFRRIGLTEARGFTIEFLALHYNLLEFVVKKEVDIFARNIIDYNLGSDEVLELSEKALEVLYKISPIMHRHFIKKLFGEILTHES
ncbi:MAG: MerR family transcriptional regulator [Proteobacteria bacterium]|nr:MerR family transcriptional regulator [Pseudomonadota bacterium]